MFLITSFPRSGTAYTTQVLKRHNVNVEHEKFGEDGIVSWVHNSYGIWLHKIEPAEFDVIIHQTRDPLKVISSAMHLSHYSMTYLLRRCRIRGQKSLLSEVMKTYYLWNLSIEKKAKYRFRVEDIEKALPVIMKLIGKKYERINIADISKTTNKRKKHKMFTWKELEKENMALTRKIKSMAKRYGY